MDEMIRQGRVVQTRPGAVPQYKRYLDEMPGVSLQNLWADLPVLNNRSQEALGFPTQKPISLLERIIRVSSNEGDIVLDPFCGCGTAIVAAQATHRRWIGIDITHLAITVMKKRLEDTFGLKPNVDYGVEGEPVSLPDAKALAAADPYQFQWWALGLVGARPTEEKKGADRGIDGRLYFHDEAPNGQTKQIVFSVKAGNLQPAFVRELRGVVDRERAAMGVLITLHPPTNPMKSEAASAGVYHSPVDGADYPRLQIITVGDLLAGKRLNVPQIGPLNVTFPRAPRAKARPAENLPLPLGPLALKEPPGPPRIKPHRKRQAPPIKEAGA
jgi:hypothetical protein